MKKILSLTIILLIGLSVVGCRRTPAPTEDTPPPVITGAQDRTVVRGSFVTDWFLNVSAHSEKDGDISSQLQINTSALDIYTEGEYPVHYSVTDSLGQETVVTITVTVVATIEQLPPTISGVVDTFIALGEDDFDFLAGISATDSVDGDLTSEVTVDLSDIDFYQEGSYTITYSVTNSNDLTTTKTANIDVLVIPYQVFNGSFETGDLSGWTSVSGNTFTSNAVTDQVYFWDNVAFNHVGTYHFRGILNQESAIGTMHSSIFKIGGIGKISFLMGAAKDTSLIYVNIRDARSHDALATISNEKFDYVDGDHPYNYAENYAQYFIDLSEYLGRYAYIEVVDADNGQDDFSFVNLDDFVTYYETDVEVPVTLLNPSFEEGLSYWTVSESFLSSTLIFEADGNSFLETPVSLTGYIRSADFRLGEDVRLSFLLKGSQETFVYVHDAHTNQILKRIEGHTFSEDITRYVFDLSLHAGKTVYVRIVDNNASGSILVNDFKLSVNNLDDLTDIPYQVPNGSFETGDLTGWVIRHGFAFTNQVITDSRTYWADITGQEARFNHVGNYHLHGLLAGEDTTGSLKSAYFRVGGEGFISFLLGAGKDPSKVFIQVKDGSTNQVLETITNDRFDFVDFETSYLYANNYSRYYVDLTDYMGRVVYLEIIDIDRDGGDFSYINLDDVITYYESNINVPTALTFSRTVRNVTWENFVGIFNVLDVSVDDSEVDLTMPGLYTLIFEITLLDESVQYETVTITVLDDQAPTLTGTKDHLIIIGEPKHLYDFFDGVSATDALDQDVTVYLDEDDYEATDFNQVGMYTLRYYATGDNGLTTERTVTIEVIDPQDTPYNAGFETGNLEGWRIISGDAFNEDGVTDASTFWNEGFPFNHVGSYHFFGVLAAPEDAVGVMHSDYFRLSINSSGWVSFLIGAGNPEHSNIYVEVVEAFTGAVVSRVYNEHMTNNEYHRYYIDLSDYLGYVFYFRIVDNNANPGGFAFINIDDFVTYYEETPAFDVAIAETVEIMTYESLNLMNYITLPVNIPAHGVNVTYTGTFDNETVGTYPITVLVEYQGLSYEQIVTVEVTQNVHSIVNGDFETGDLTGWTVLSGNAFCESGVTSETTFWNRPFNHEGIYHFRGFLCGESLTGTMRSTDFVLGGVGYISLLMGGARDQERTYISVMDAETNTEIHHITNTQFSDPNQSENYAQYIVDLSEHLGKTLYILVVDNNDDDSGFAFINLDNVITYHETIPTLD